MAFAANINAFAEFEFGIFLLEEIPGVNLFRNQMMKGQCSLALA